MKNTSSLFRNFGEYFFGTETLREYKRQLTEGRISPEQYGAGRFDLIVSKASLSALTLMGALAIPAPHILDAHNAQPCIEWAALFGSASILGSELMRYFSNKQARENKNLGTETGRTLCTDII